MKHFEEASHLLAYANEFLDSLENTPPSSPEEALERAREISFLISEMRRFNFHAPKFGIRDLFKELRFTEKEEMLEIAPSLKKLMYALNIRKWTYERAKVAYLSNRLAYFSIHFDALTDFLPYLPYGGSYLSFAEKGGGAAYQAFRDLEKLLRGESRVEAVFKGEIFLEVEKKTKKGTLPSSTALLLAYLSISSVVDKALATIKEKVKEEVDNLEEVLRYESIVNRYDIKRLEEDPEYLWKLLQELEENGFLEEDGTVRSDILLSLREKRSIEYTTFLSLAEEALTRFLLHYYLSFPRGVRERKPPLRGMPADPSPLLPFLSSLSEEGCVVEKSALIDVLKRAMEVEDVFPFERRLLREHLLYSLCPSWGKEHGEVEAFLRSVKASERAKKFLEALEKGENDTDKDAR